MWALSIAYVRLCAIKSQLLIADAANYMVTLKLNSNVLILRGRDLTVAEFRLSLQFHPH